MKLKLQLDNTIRVDRSVRPSYPDWVKKIMHPELENTGPAEYYISEVEQWFFKKQKNGGCIKGNESYTHFKKTDTLKTCLGLRDLEEIQKKGVTFFRKHFQDRCVFGWKGVVQGRRGILYVPYLCVDGGKVVLSWYWLAFDCHDDHPALRFARSAKN